ncbi:arginine transporter permease subunit ArtM [Photobacterium aquimaris]|uniref:Arginine ABC transporter permease protein ArtM n=3 Tax=Photobacterium TaxID=657 RepID=A0A2T3IMA4_9GAMM|nr:MULTISPECIES: arginine ABC transporter permease ArtM [Photobacterium]OBU14383.1 arginine transporter permease subunit ArtM [Photobacterium aquimaris]OBU19104.1 arginine transporter permease subunit ArtM [Photobacterium aquimaris]PSU29474.1 arginine ABC transporter permease ArtM [Photobacterium aquimaris]PSW01215.1 arginine ABC transporter permease ArtM [Photobacterium aquimaris]SMY31551.1 Arginine ABC transporter permease protein ArtM [Photobacterium malacitanum]
MNEQNFWLMVQGLITSLELTAASLFVGCSLALLMTASLILRTPIIHWISRGIITLFTGTPLLVQIFLVYYGPGQFEVIRQSFLWDWLSQPWFCAMLALALNTAAYSTQLFKGAFDAIPKGQWHACRALGMNTKATLGVLLPFAIRRAVPAYSNEVILVFKGTSLASTITIMDIMGYAQRINAQTYDTLTVFAVAGAFYLAVNGVLTLIFRVFEKKALAFEAAR